MLKNKKTALDSSNQAGFIPMLIMLAVLLAVVIWFAYKHVNDAHKKQVLQKASQYENSLSQ